MTVNQTVGYLPSLQQAIHWSQVIENVGGIVRCGVDVVGPLDADRLRNALDAEVNRQEILRTVFVRQSGLRTPLQQILPELKVVWDDSPLDLARGPVVYAQLSTVGPGVHQLNITASNLCSDLESLKRLMRDVANTYGGGAASESEVTQYVDYAEWQRRYLADEPSGRQSQEFWRQHLSTLPVPVSFQLESSGLATGTSSSTLSPEVLSHLKSVANDLADTETKLLAVWAALLSRLTATEHIVVDVRHSGRTMEELQVAIGPYDKVLPIAVDCEKNLPFSELTAQITVLRGELDQHHEAYPQIEADFAGRSKIEFEYVDLSTVLTTGATTWRLRSLDDGIFAGKLKLSVSQFADGVQLKIQADESVFGVGSAGRIMEYYRRLLEAFWSNPAQSLAAPALIGPEESAEIMAEAKSISSELPSVSVVEMFERFACTYLESQAVRCGQDVLTYRELLEYSGRIACRLQDLGIGPDATVGLLLDRSVDLIAALWGILRAGAAYVPLHEDLPVERLSKQLADAQVAAVISRRGQHNSAPITTAAVICLEDIVHGGSQPMPRTISLDTTAYILFTSGSTGAPKGVAVTHRNLANYSFDLAGRLDAFDAANPCRSFASVTTVASDLGNTAIFPAFISGGCLHLIPLETATNRAAMENYCGEYSFDVLKITPSHLTALIADGSATDLLPRRYLVMGGEPLAWELVNKVANAGSCRLLNHYGPTETTVGALVCPVDEMKHLEASTRSVPIGRPVANTRCYVVDSRMRLMPRGVPGELLIGGAGVARGYVQRDDESAQRFLPDPFLVGRSRVYRTGDIVRRVNGGFYEFLGRNDDQIKIRGYRIECGEIARTLEQHGSISSAAVLAVPNHDGSHNLAAFATSSIHPAPLPAELISFLKRFLPEYMVPPQIILLDALPLDRNGKLNRRAMMDLAQSARSLGARPVALLTETERNLARIWSDILKIASIDRHDNFLAIGGHSLSAMQVIAKIQDVFDVTLPLPVLFDRPVLCELAAEIDKQEPSVRDVSDDELLEQLRSMPSEMVASLLGESANAGGEVT